MKVEVGDYVRFYDRDLTEIGQIVDEVEDSHLKVVKCKDGYYDLDNFIKSGSIIDLIEVGDYVNGYKVISIGIDDNHKNVELYVANQGYDELVLEQDIKSIVTKEQFESMEYKVGDEE